MILPIPLWLQAAVLAVASAISFGAGWSVRGMKASAAVAKVQVEQSTQRADRAELARKDEEATAAKERTYATVTLQAAEKHSFSAPGRDYDLRVQLAIADRLRSTAEERAARYRAQAESGAASCSALADRTARLDAALAEGKGLAAELRAALEQRNVDVTFLLEYNKALRALTDSE